MLLNRLARRPTEIAAAKQMQMEVENGLPGAAAVVENGAVARQETTLFGKLCCDKLQLAEQILIGRRGVMQ
jgi:hypothetical protein